MRDIDRMNIIPPKFEEYKCDKLEKRSNIEKITMLDSEISKIEYFGLQTYIPPFDAYHPEEKGKMENYYNRLFSEFLSERLEGIIDIRNLREQKTNFKEFSESIARINKSLESQRVKSTVTLSKPAEMVLLKQLRIEGFDPNDLKATYIKRGGALYLLELFVISAQQQVASKSLKSKYPNDLFFKLLEKAENLSNLEKSQLKSILQYPVLMVDLWKNQEKGLEKWLAGDRRGILEMATATGKTVAGLGAIAYICGCVPSWTKSERPQNNVTIIIVAHSHPILNQWKREIINKLGFLTAGSQLEEGSTLPFGNGKIEFRTVQSLLPHNRPERDLEEEYDLAIFDEVHHYSNVEGFGSAIKTINSKLALGLSATIGNEGDPRRKNIEKTLGPVIYTYSIEEAKKDGIIPEFKWRIHPIALDPYERKEWEKISNSIKKQFQQIKSSKETNKLLENKTGRNKYMPKELKNLNDFILAYKAIQLDPDIEKPKNWEDWKALQNSIQSRNWIRHRSQPKMEGAIDLCKKYLSKKVKCVVFSMDIETTEKITEELRKVTDNVFIAHSKLAKTQKKTKEEIQMNIKRFSGSSSGVLVAPKLLDEGIDVPDAEVGINVAGTKTKLQLVQRMGRILRKDGNKKPVFHHFIAVPEDGFISDIDSKEYVQEVNWAYELGEQIGQTPAIEESAYADKEVLRNAEKRGNELWTHELLSDFRIESVQGSIRLKQILDSLEVEHARVLRRYVDKETKTISRDNWRDALKELKDETKIDLNTLQQVWWLFPMYKENPKELYRLFTQIINK